MRKKLEYPPPLGSDLGLQLVEEGSRRVSMGIL